MKFIDGRNTDEATAEQVRAFIYQLAEDHADSDATVIKVTDSHGNHIERMKLFQEKLTDGSVVLNLELHFENQR